MAKWHILQQKGLNKWIGSAPLEHGCTTFNTLHRPATLKLPSPFHYKPCCHLENKLKIYLRLWYLFTWFRLKSTFTARTILRRFDVNRWSSLLLEGPPSPMAAWWDKISPASLEQHYHVQPQPVGTRWVLPLVYEFCIIKRTGRHSSYTSCYRCYICWPCCVHDVVYVGDRLLGRWPALW